MPPPEPMPYRLLGSSGRARLQQRLEAATRRWLDTWTAKDAVPCSIRLASADQPLQPVLDPLAELHRVRANGTAALEVCFHPRAASVVVGVPAPPFAGGAALPRAGGLAGRLAAALLRGLVNELMDSASIADWELEDLGTRPRGETPNKLLFQRALVVVGDRELAMLELSPLVVNALVPAGASQAKGRFEPRRGAIGKARMKIEAILGNVELSVSDFLSLDRGDVIVLDTRLGQRCQVQVPAVAAVADATVGKSGDRRAIRIGRTEAGAHK